MSLEQYSILIVDDDSATRELLKTLLCGQEFQVAIAQDGRRALEEMEGKPDLVLLDRSMPEMTGLDVCRKIREDDRFAQVAVILLTSMNTPQDIIDGLYSGADDYITKPFNPDELLARVKSQLRRREQMRLVKAQEEDRYHEIQEILANNSLRTFFQPIYQLPDLTFQGVEVFTRPPMDSTFTNPEILFKSAIQTGQYFQLEMSGWERALELWKQQINRGVVFLNCSPFLIEHDDFSYQMLESFAVSPRQVVLEITERSSVRDSDGFLQRLQAFKEHGGRIAVDDVGSGYSSFETVARISPDFLKIDLTLLRDIHRYPIKQNIVQSIIDFSRKSGFGTVAEGIEYEAELSMMRGMGADAVQGYFLGRPVPVEDLKLDSVRHPTGEKEES